MHGLVAGREDASGWPGSSVLSLCAGAYMEQGDGLWYVAYLRQVRVGTRGGVMTMLVRPKWKWTVMVLSCPVSTRWWFYLPTDAGANYIYILVLYCSLQACLLLGDAPWLELDWGKGWMILFPSNQMWQSLFLDAAAKRVLGARGHGHGS